MALLTLLVCLALAPQQAQQDAPAYMTLGLSDCMAQIFEGDLTNDIAVVGTSEKPRTLTLNI